MKYVRGAACLMMFGLTSCSVGGTDDASVGAIASSGVAPKTSTRAQRSNLSDPNLPRLVNKLKASSRSVITVVQLGDSHTAADLFSGEMRRLFQRDYGDAGIGFIAATPVPGTRYDNVRITTDKRQWTLVSSRNQHSDQFPLGGYLSLPVSSRPTVHLETIEPSEQRYRISTLYQASRSNILQARDGNTQARVLPATTGQWRLSPAINNVHLPVDLTFASNVGIVVGGWNIQSQRTAGVLYSSLGINGATFDVVDKWQAGWLDTLKALRPDLLIVAYGTNEAYDDSLDLARYEARLKDKMIMLRNALPATVFLVTGAPDSVRNKKAIRCEDRQANNLRSVIQTQKRVAAQVNAAFWDWQAFMGGNCAIENWQARELARSDLVHMTAEGYRQSASALYAYIKELLDSVKR
ncbi:GDSL-type esterase/lipase family protein [Pseudomonas mohnii]|uniref:GDSL-type esterase/lipase family protein n=1 Tax=Pseudomonas mohnii TaxID=395600 RepID=UPI0018C84304|nr:GDSL-type esterase/lipase family protein [Pseudomonas mohnii]MBH8611145.1 hypothetical protein [Pseudomonas mohnii]